MERLGAPWTEWLFLLFLPYKIVHGINVLEDSGTIVINDDFNITARDDLVSTGKGYKEVMDRLNARKFTEK